MYYVPSEDTFLLADCVVLYHGKWALEIGVGSGLILQLLEGNFQNVAGSDISLKALEHCRREEPDAMLVCCDAASAFTGKYNLIVSNPPYLPDDYYYDNYYNNEANAEAEGKRTNDYARSSSRIKKDTTVHGGPKGVETTIHFIRSALPLLAQDGKMLFVVSSLANLAELERFLATEIKMNKKVVKEKRLFYETLSVIELSLF